MKEILYKYIMNSLKDYDIVKGLHFPGLDKDKDKDKEKNIRYEYILELLYTGINGLNLLKELDILIKNGLTFDKIKTSSFILSNNIYYNVSFEIDVRDLSDFFIKSLKVSEKFNL